ncbi:hypothetical protein [Streptomyces sp. AC495_CC817]|uniref:hypothetical protein n=1 Tax=Streptomyces sp. AC495_CC817 TaxID=2823900 RepID=UPI001C27C876|nr:hypothetical protein [Streptomyces sp. AC495_CC817]
MSTPHPIVDDAALGPLSRATSELTDGSVLTHDWYAGTTTVDGADVELMIEGTTPDEVTPLLPRLRDAVAHLGELRRIATGAVVTRFSTGEPEQHELDDAASDLRLEAVEATSGGTIVLHLIDGCGEHFPEGYWPAVHFGPDGAVEQVTVES